MKFKILINLFILFFLNTVFLNYAKANINNKNETVFKNVNINYHYPLKKKVFCNFYIKNKAYNVCYSKIYKGAKVVSYFLYGNKVNRLNIRKRPKWKVDKRLPVNLRTYSSDYTHSGYDRGHLFPDADADYNYKILESAYYMSNIVPQYPNVNRKGWMEAEKFERKMAKKYGKIEVLNLVNYSTRYIPRIGRHGVAIPNSFYKIIKSPKKTQCFLFYNEKRPTSSNIKSHKINCDKVILKGM